jgi:hypothetical protein
VPPSPDGPLFSSSFPLSGALRVDEALCSLLSLGPDVTRVVSEPEDTSQAAPLEETCQRGPPIPGGKLVQTSTAYGPVRGYLLGGADPATGLLVVFSGLGMPSAGWINERFAQTAAKRGFLTFAPVRDESPRPIYFDPVREARRALDAARQIAATCHVGEPGDFAFVGVSLGGLEALLANREALQHGMTTRAVVLDPLLDPALATANLDSFWHGMAEDSVQGYFRRILTGRYRESPPPRFEDVMKRTEIHREALSDLRVDAPSAWLCQARREAYIVFLSDTDPVLGDGQRQFAESCGFPLKKARVPGHVPLACRLELFDEMIAELREADQQQRRPATMTWATLPEARRSPGDRCPDRSSVARAAARRIE